VIGIRERQPLSRMVHPGGQVGRLGADVMASVCAEIAHRQAWLTADRVLSADEHEHLRRTARPRCARDHRHSKGAASAASRGTG
jgi:hypothetical protein